jgi:hypothetical protein
VTAVAAKNGIVALAYQTNKVEVFSDSTFQKIATLTLSDQKAQVMSLAIGPDYLAAGEVESDSDYGTVYVFAKGQAWHDSTETAKLTPSDGKLTSQTAFGWSVGVYGTTLVAGAPTAGAENGGRVYIFEEPPTGWVDATQTAELSSLQPGPWFGFGQSVAVIGVVGQNGSTIAVGSPAASTKGEAYVFLEPGGGWINATPNYTLTSSVKNQTGFGISVALGKGALVVAATGNDLTSLSVWNAPYHDSSSPDATLTDAAVLGFGAVSINQSGGQIAACCGWSGRYPIVLNRGFLFNKPKVGPWKGTQSVANVKLIVPMAKVWSWNIAIDKDTAVLGVIQQKTGAAFIY